jgi:hypothetical protein
MIVSQSAKKPPKRPPRYKRYTVKLKYEVIDYASSHDVSVAVMAARMKWKHCVLKLATVQTLSEFNLEHSIQKRANKFNAN